MSRGKPGGGPIRLLVVCLGNICRSPAAEAAIGEAAAARDLPVVVASAGTGPWHVGERPHPQVRAAGARVGLDIDGRGRQVTTPADLEGYDLVLAMDRSNLRRLQELAPELSDRMHLFRSFDPHADHHEVPDPYGHPDHVFDETIRIVRSAAAGLIDALESG
jgi:protein-tyrosine phosphatase